MGRIINFVSAKGGVGKSSLVYALSLALSEKNYKVCVLDGCFYYNSYSAIWKGDNDLKNYLSGTSGAFECLNRVNRNLYFVKTDSILFDYFSKLELIKIFIEEISFEFDYVFIDSNAFDKKSFDALASVSREVIVVLTDEIFAIKNTAKLISKLKLLKNVNSLKMVINKAKIIGVIEGKKLGQKDIEKLLKIDTLFVIPYLFKYNYLKMGKINIFSKNLVQKFCYSIITNQYKNINYQKRYKGLLGFLRRKVYGKFE